MRFSTPLLAAASLAWFLAATQALAAEPTPAAAKEQRCDDGKDDDGDAVIDCGDADCFEAPACQPDGEREHTNARCSDWVDNDSDGFVMK